MRYKAVFFDFDGTLMDTGEGVCAGGRHAMEALGYVVPELDDWSVFIGPPLTECFRRLFGIKDETVLSKLVVEYRKYYNEQGYKQACFYPGIVELIRSLKENGVLVACTTLKTEFLAKKMLEHFGVASLFDGTFGLDIAEKVTKADLCRNAMEKFGLKAEDCVLIGDTEFDEDGAREAGIGFIPVTWGFGFKKGYNGAVSNIDELTARL